MENNTATIEKLIEKSEVYAKTTLELFKYEAVYKSAEIFSHLAVKIVVGIIVVLFMLLVNIGLSLFIGQKIGEIYYGFFVVSVVNLFLVFLIYIYRDEWVKRPVSNFIINQMKSTNEL